MAKSIDIPDELYERLGTYARPFETPAQVIERLLDLAGGPTDDSASTPLRKAESSATSVSTPYTGKLEINFFPSDPMAFKAQLLEQKEAWVRLFYFNGKHETKNWIARSFKPSSDVLGNLRSGYLRGWREKGIIRADVAIKKDDLPDEGENA